MNTDRKVAGHIAKAAGIHALAVDFRRSPENKFPAQQNDVETAYRWLLSQGYHPEKIASGGNFSFSLAECPHCFGSISVYNGRRTANRTVASNG